MNSLNSIDKDLCFKTDSKVLEYINLCKICHMIPLPSYNSIKDQENQFCKPCYHTLNIDPEHTIPPNKFELKSLEDLIISCKYYITGCNLEFSFRTINEMVDSY